MDKLGVGRPRPVVDAVDARTGALLAALRRLPAAERRCVVLSHMAGASLGEIAAIEQLPLGTVQARLARARMVVSEGLADVLPEVLGTGMPTDDGYGYGDESAAVTHAGDLLAGYDDEEGDR
jgi:RNA polymerase sigma-70 factor (ECF subfamily)